MFKKDARILYQSFADYDFKPELANMARNVNESFIPTIVKGLANKIYQKFKHSDIINIAILGFAFKGEPETNDMRDSTVYNLIQELRANFIKFKFHGYDKLVDDKYFIDLDIDRAKTIEECIENKNLIIIHNNHKDFNYLKNQEEVFAKNNILFYSFFH